MQMRFIVSHKYVTATLASTAMLFFLPIITTIFVQIGVLHGVVDDVDTVHKLQTSHEQPLCTALYNTNFKQVSCWVYSKTPGCWMNEQITHSLRDE